MQTHPLAGVYAAAVTPLNSDDTLDIDSIPALWDFYARRGLHGLLLMGTTGEGPSFSTPERQTFWEAAAQARQSQPDLRLIAGTGSPSLDETCTLNKIAFNLGFDAVLTLPPYYFRNASEDGLFSWFSEVIRRSVPEDGLFLVYHIPQVSGVPLPITLLKRLRDAFPKQFIGIKDSSGDLEHAKMLGREIADRVILVGNDRLLTPSLNSGGAGCITALANISSPDLRSIWDAHQRGEDTDTLQAKIDQARGVLEKYPPPAAFLKTIMAEVLNLPRWAVRLPFLPIDDDTAAQAVEDIRQWV